MNETITAYPLCWPAGWKRTAPENRKRAAFRSYGRELSVADGVGRVVDQVRLLGVDPREIIISTNLEPRLDGMPRSGKESTDPGVAVYWGAGKGQKCMAVDRYDRVADNLGAVALTIQAMRAIERHGGAEILERAFLGFVALPAPMEAGRPWYEVLKVCAVGSLDEAESSYRKLAKVNHPDNGGDPGRMAELNEAIRQAREVLK